MSGRDSGDKVHDGMIDLFLSYLPDNGSVLDVGCAAGNDSAYFKTNGRSVEAVDSYQALCDSASKLLGQAVPCLTIMELDYCEQFDGVWVSGEFVHVTEIEFSCALSKLVNALRINGILYVAMRAGDFVGDGEGTEGLLRFDKKQAVAAFTESKELELLDSSLRYYPGKDKDAWIHLMLRRVRMA